jgi:hypothetical protein
VAVDLVCQLVHGVVDEVPGERCRTGGTHGLGLGGATVHAGDLVTTGGEQPGESAADASGGTDLEHLHDRHLPFDVVLEP